MRPSLSKWMMSGRASDTLRSCNPPRTGRPAGPRPHLKKATDDGAESRQPSHRMSIPPGRLQAVPPMRARKRR